MTRLTLIAEMAAIAVSALSAAASDGDARMRGDLS